MPFFHVDCADWLTVLHPYLVEPLFQSAAVARLRRLAAHLPGDCAGVFELRLASDSHAVDFSIRLEDPAGSWSAPEGSFRNVSSVWLEFDLDRDPQGLAPLVCAKLRPATEAAWILESLLPALHGKPLSSAQRQGLALALCEIPAPAFLLYAFSLLPRGSDAVRLEIFGLDPAGIVSYLEKVSPSSIPWVREPAALFAGVERIHLSLDLGTEILPRIGIEGSFSRLPRREPHWHRLFDRLVKSGLCAAEKRDAALAWSGYDNFWTAPERWPVAPRPVPGFCVRRLSHVKVVCRPDQEPEAKAYLMFVPLERSGAVSSPASRSASAA